MASETVAALAREAGLSRSTFFERFGREVGVTPMAYLLAWRIALAKDLLGREGAGVAEVAERVGYGSVSTFSTAFARHVGRPPIHYAPRAARPIPEPYASERLSRVGFCRLAFGPRMHRSRHQCEDRSQLLLRMGTFASQRLPALATRALFSLCL